MSADVCDIPRQMQDHVHQQRLFYNIYYRVEGDDETRYH